MTVYVRWNPFRESAALNHWVNRLAEDAWRENANNDLTRRLPLEVRENDEAYTIVAALPGVNPEQVQVQFYDGVLTISAELPAAPPANGSRLLLQERAAGKFARSLRLPQAVDTVTAQAVYEQGLLTLTLPKTPEAKPRLIPVKNSALLNQN